MRPVVTLFSIAKPFLGFADIAQRNAISSWRRLTGFEVLLFGDDDGTARAAEELGVKHMPGIRRNEHGTPLVSSAFEMARAASDTPYMMYANCDIILLDTFRPCFDRLSQFESLPEFLAIARRIDLPFRELIDFGDRDQRQELKRRVQADGVPSSIVCKEFFLFSRTLYQAVPDFAVGRGNWDNWMLYSVKQRGIPVIDMSPCTRIVHQNHDYTHQPRRKFAVYVSGPEAKQNQKLAGGRHLIAGSTATWTLRENGLRRNRRGFLNGEIWRDIPRFARLLASFVR